MIVRRTVGLTVTVLAVACGGGDPSSPGPVTRGIRIVSGDNVTDSAGALLTAALIVEVHDSTGAVAPSSTLVRFEPIEDLLTRVAPLTSAVYGQVATGQTDPTGRTGAFVLLTRRAGPVRIAISAPTLGLRDTAHYVVTPASLAAVDATPEDTALYAGRPYTLQVATRDQYGNTRADAVTWAIQGSGATVTPAGVVTATVLGMHHVIASAAALRDTVRLSAIPQGTLTAHEYGVIVTIELDGSNRKVRTTAVNAGIGVRPRWLAESDRIVYSTFNNVIQELRVADATGASVPFLPSPPSTMSHQADAAPAPDGSWVYFAAHDTRCVIDEYCLFRSRPDGSSIELLGNDASPGVVSFRPSSSPDGRQVVFVTLVNGAAALKVMNADSRTVSAWSVAGVFPQWSPSGGTIAFLDASTHALKLMNTDGTGVRELTDDPEAYTQGRFSWSPDGEWIIRPTNNGMNLVRTATGEVLPVRHLYGLSEPSWK
jgi:hypothetical protein